MWFPPLVVYSNSIFSFFGSTLHLLPFSYLLLSYGWYLIFQPDINLFRCHVPLWKKLFDQISCFFHLRFKCGLFRILQCRITESHSSHAKSVWGRISNLMLLPDGTGCSSFWWTVRIAWSDVSLSTYRVFASDTSHAPLSAGQSYFPDMPGLGQSSQGVVGTQWLPAVSVHHHGGFSISRVSLQERDLSDSNKRIPQPAHRCWAHVTVKCNQIWCSIFLYKFFLLMISQ